MSKRVIDLWKAFLPNSQDSMSYDLQYTRFYLSKYLRHDFTLLKFSHSILFIQIQFPKQTLWRIFRSWLEAHQIQGPKKGGKNSILVIIIILLKRRTIAFNKAGTLTRIGSPIVQPRQRAKGWKWCTLESSNR